MKDLGLATERVKSRETGASRIEGGFGRALACQALNTGNDHLPSTSMVMSFQYHQLLSDYGPPHPGDWEQLGALQQTRWLHHSRVGQRDRHINAGSKHSLERLERSIIILTAGLSGSTT